MFKVGDMIKHKYTGRELRIIEIRTRVYPHGIRREAMVKATDDVQFWDLEYCELISK